MMRFLKPYLKAHTAGLGAAVTLLLTYLSTGLDLDLKALASIAVAFLGAGAATSLVPNLPVPVVGDLLDAPEDLLEGLGLQDDGTDDA